MKKGATILVRIFVSFLIFLIVHSINFALMKAQGRHSTSGIGWIIYPAAFAGIVAVWRRKPKGELPTLHKTTLPTLNKD